MLHRSVVLLGVAFVLFSSNGCSSAEAAEAGTAGTDELRSSDVIRGTPQRHWLPGGGSSTLRFSLDHGRDVVIGINAGVAPVRVYAAGGFFGRRFVEEDRTRAGKSWRFFRVALDAGKNGIVLENPYASQLPVVVSVSDYPRSWTPPPLVGAEGTYRMDVTGPDGARSTARMIVKHVSRCSGAELRQAHAAGGGLPPVDGYCVSFPDGRVGRFTLSRPRETFFDLGSGELGQSLDPSVVVKVDADLQHHKPLSRVALLTQGSGALSWTHDSFIPVTRTGDAPP